mmetsp:Transcript_42252/g.140011  ORF Transcript_42252/g.140011 Transcript_42252/m.140011 type:complete len:200 (-) Transcript_42252:455-1054(-)
MLCIVRLSLVEQRRMLDSAAPAGARRVLGCQGGGRACGAMSGLGRKRAGNCACHASGRSTDVEAGAESLRRPEPPLEHLVEEAHEEGAAGGVDPFGHQIVRDGAQARHRCLRRGPGQRARALPPPHSPAGEACREARPPRRCSEAVCRRAAPRGRRGTARPSGRGSAPQSRNRGAAPRPRLARSPPQRAGSGAAGCGRR